MQEWKKQAMLDSVMQICDPVKEEKKIPKSNC